MGTAKDYNRATALVLLTSGLALVLSACGGGGGGSSDPAPRSSVSPSAGSTPPPSSNLPTDSLDAGGNRRLTLAWTSTAENSDGTCSAGIRGYRVNLGVIPGIYAYTAMIHHAQTRCTTLMMNACGEVQRCAYTVDRLVPASWYLTVQSVDVNGRESVYSEEIVAAVN